MAGYIIYYPNTSRLVFTASRSLWIAFRVLIFQVLQIVAHIHIRYLLTVFNIVVNYDLVIVDIH